LIGSTSGNGARFKNEGNCQDIKGQDFSFIKCFLHKASGNGARFKNEGNWKDIKGQDFCNWKDIKG